MPDLSQRRESMVEPAPVTAPMSAGASATAITPAWGPNNYFYYSTTIRGPYVRDDGHHFRREHWAQGRHFRMRGRIQRR